MVYRYLNLSISTNMEIFFFHWSSTCGPSITRSFEPLIRELAKEHTVKEFRVPYAGANPINVLRNILFVYRHRTSKGINHITGDIHYCILGLLGVKSVLTIHDDYAIIKAPNILNRIYKWIFWIYLPIKLADRVLCITSETMLKIHKYVHTNKLQVLTQHIPDDGFVFSSHHFNTDCPLILQIGTDKQKNLESTLYALKEVKCKLRVIKKMTKQQHALAQKLKIDYSNAYNLTANQIIDEYKNADFVVFPSLYEGFGMPIIEAQAIGRVIITSNISPMNWVAGKDAILLNNPLDIYEYREVIRKVINSQNLRERTINSGLKNVKRFSLETVLRNFIELYKSIK